MAANYDHLDELPPDQPTLDDLESRIIAAESRLGAKLDKVNNGLWAIAIGLLLVLYKLFF